MHTSCTGCPLPLEQHRDELARHLRNDQEHIAGRSNEAVFRNP
jgi:hypothetical protein